MQFWESINPSPFSIIKKKLSKIQQDNSSAQSLGKFLTSTFLHEIECALGLEPLKNIRNFGKKSKKNII